MEKNSEIMIITGALWLGMRQLIIGTTTRILLKIVQDMLKGSRQPSAVSKNSTPWTSTNSLQIPAQTWPFLDIYQRATMGPP